MRSTQDERYLRAADVMAGGSGAISTAAGGNMFASGIKDVIAAIKNRNIAKENTTRHWKELIKKVQTGDIIITSSPDDWHSSLTNIANNLYDLGAQSDYLRHSYLAMPDETGVQKMFTPIAAGFNRTTANPRLNNMARPRTWKQLKSIRSPSDLKNFITKLVDKGIARIKPIDNAIYARELADTMDLIEGFKDSKFIHVLRPKGGLSPDEVTKLTENIKNIAGRYTATEVDNTAGQLARFFNIPVKANLPTNCAGGICKAYEGIRNFGTNIYKAIPKDFANNPALDVIGTAVRTKSLPKYTVAKELFRTSLKPLTGLGIAGAGLGASAYLFNKGNKNSPNFNLLGIK